MPDWTYNPALLRFEYRDEQGRVTQVVVPEGSPTEPGVQRMEMDIEMVRALQRGGAEGFDAYQRMMNTLTGAPAAADTTGAGGPGTVGVALTPAMRGRLAEHNAMILGNEADMDKLARTEQNLRTSIASTGAGADYWFGQFAPPPAAPTRAVETSQTGAMTPEQMAASTAEAKNTFEAAMLERQRRLQQVSDAWERNKAGTDVLAAQQDAAWELEQANQFQPPSSVEEGVKLLTPQGLMHTTAAGARQYQAERNYDRAIDRAGVRFGQRPLPRYGIGGVTPMEDEPLPEYDPTEPPGTSGGNPINPTTGGTYAGGRQSPTFGAPPPPPPPTFQQPKPVDPANTIAGQQKAMDDDANARADIARSEQQAMQDIATRRAQALAAHQQRMGRLNLELEQARRQAMQEMATLNARRMDIVARNPFAAARLPTAPGITPYQRAATPPPSMVGAPPPMAGVA